jgi:hypothetical protein
MPKERRINVRAKGDLKDRLRRACQIIGASESSLIVACVESLVNYIESHGEITLPIMVVPKSALKKTGATSILTNSGGGMTGKLFVEELQASSPTNKSATNSDYAANSEAEVPLRERRETTHRRKTRRTQTSHSRQSALWA